MAEALSGIKAPPLAMKLMTAELVGDMGASADRQSYLSLLAQVKGGGLDKYWTDTEVYLCRGGNQRLAQKLAEAIGSESILLNTPASSVTIKDNQVVVTGSDGKTFTADDAILTVPPSVWSNIKFDPALPEALRPQMVSAVKYLMSLKNRFWLADKLSPIRRAMTTSTKPGMGQPVRKVIHQPRWSRSRAVEAPMRCGRSPRKSATRPTPRYWGSATRIF